MLVVALLALLSLCSADLAPLIEPELAEIVEDSYIVVYKDETPDEVFAMDVLVAVQQYEVAHHYTTALKGYAAKMTPAQLESVRALPYVSYIEKDQVMYALDCDNAHKYGSWGQTRVAEKLKTVWNELYAAPTTAKDINIYIVDTGIYVHNQDFQGRAEFAFRADAKWSDTDANGHGTHVASTSAGHLYGIAKGASLFAVKVLGDDGYGTNAGVIAGVDFAVADATRRGASKGVINMSLGGGKSTVLDAAVNSAVAQNVVVVVAAGNENADACNGSPSGAGSVVTVGSTEQGIPGGKDGRSWFSNWGTCVDIFAPGTSIKAAWNTGVSATNTISGTSMASPHVAGIAALIRANNPELSATGVKAQLISSASVGNIELACQTAGKCEQSPNRLANNGCDISTEKAAK